MISVHCFAGIHSVSSLLYVSIADVGNLTFYFGVKFYAADPCKLREEGTRYVDSHVELFKLSTIKCNIYLLLFNIVGGI